LATDGEILDWFLEKTRPWVSKAWLAHMMTCDECWLGIDDHTEWLWWQVDNNLVAFGPVTKEDYDRGNWLRQMFNKSLEEIAYDPLSKVVRPDSAS
jgi:hypothetical protein